MITFNTNHVRYDQSITSEPIDGFVILYETPAKGHLSSHILKAYKTINPVESIDESGETVITTETTYQTIGAFFKASKHFDQSYFDGLDILGTLHQIYLQELQQYNPNIEFTSTV